jgi:hypothetical protein
MSSGPNSETGLERTSHNPYNISTTGWTIKEFYSIHSKGKRYSSSSGIWVTFPERSIEFLDRFWDSLNYQKIILQV